MKTPWALSLVGRADSAGALLAVLSLGCWVRHRRTRAAVLQERNCTLDEARRSRDAALAAVERAQAAGEIQDLVTHSLTAITVQTAAARRLLRSDPDTAERLLATVEQVGRESTEEMRSSLALLRPAGEAPAREPQPGLGDLDALVAHARDAGVQVEVTIRGTPVALDPGTSLTAYRVVEQVLVAARDEPGCRVRVGLNWSSDRLDVQIDERGPVGRDGSAARSERLLGERVGACGGRYRATRQADGGVMRTVTFPTSRSST